MPRKTPAPTAAQAQASIAAQTPSKPTKTAQTTKPAPKKSHAQQLAARRHAAKIQAALRLLEKEGIKTTREDNLANATRADANLRQPNRRIEVGGAVGQDRPRDMSVDGDARNSLSGPEIEPVDKIIKSHADELKFMEELVEVRVHSSTDRNAEPIVGPIGVNGRNQYFPRNVVVRCKRKFVERLARTRTTGFSQEIYKDANGDTAIRNHPVTSLRYPFSIERDDNPNGRDWINRVLQEA
jgi:hypothetical protein